MGRLPQGFPATAILRGKQVVVSGDSKQLSPTSTSFFTTSIEEDDEDPAERDNVTEYKVDAVKEAESLLEAMKASLPRLTQAGSEMPGRQARIHSS